MYSECLCFMIFADAPQEFNSFGSRLLTAGDWYLLSPSELLLPGARGDGRSKLVRLRRWSCANPRKYDKSYRNSIGCSHLKRGSMLRTFSTKIVFAVCG